MQLGCGKVLGAVILANFETAQCEEEGEDLYLIHGELVDLSVMDTFDHGEVYII